MNIPKSLVSDLSEDARQVIRQIDNLIDVYEHQNKSPDHIEVWANKWKAIEKSLKRHKLSLSNDTYRGYKLISKAKPRRYNKRKLREFEAL